MQEVFERIIEKLEQIKELYHRRIYKKDKTGEEALNIVIPEIKRIIEEYNNGWILVSERLPENDKQVLITLQWGKEICIVISERCKNGWFLLDATGGFLSDNSKNAKVLA